MVSVVVSALGTLRIVACVAVFCGVRRVSGCLVKCLCDRCWHLLVPIGGIVEWWRCRMVALPNGGIAEWWRC